MKGEHTVQGRYRTAGLLGPTASSVTLAWLATHRGRLWTFLLGGRRLSVLVIWDVQGSRYVEHSDDEVEALATIVYGEPRHIA